MEWWWLVESNMEHSWERESCGVLKVEWQLNEGRWVSVLVNLGLIWDEWLEQKSIHFILIKLELICFILEEFRSTGKLLHLHFFEKHMNIYYVWLCLCLGYLSWITYVTNHVVLTLYITYILASKLAVCSTWEYNLCGSYEESASRFYRVFFFFFKYWIWK